MWKRFANKNKTVGKAALRLPQQKHGGTEVKQLKGLGWLQGCALAYALIWWIAPELLLERRWLLLIPVGALWWACNRVKKAFEELQRRVELSQDRIRYMEKHKND